MMYIYIYMLYASCSGKMTKECRDFVIDVKGARRDVISERKSVLNTTAVDA